MSNLDSEKPFGQFTRPFFLGRGMAGLGAIVGNVAPDCARVDFGPSWETGGQSLTSLLRATKAAVAEFAPDVIYAHQNMPAVAAILARPGVPIVADSHALASEEWRLRARDQGLRESVVCRIRQAKAFGAERLIIRQSALVMSAGEELSDLLAAKHGAQRLCTVVNGVDDRILDSPATVAPAAFEAPGPHIVATLPSASSTANERALAFLVESAPFIHEICPTASIHVLGTDPGDGPSAPGLVYEGMQDVLPWIDHASTCLMPYPPEAVVLGGVRNKLLEYLARARTLVTTPEGLMGFTESGAWDGVTIAPDDAAGFAAAVVSATQPTAVTLISRRDHVRETVSWDRHAGDVLAALAQTVESKSRSIAPPQAAQ